MSTYKQNDLTEEIFGHLCNVALHKCSDKTEKKRAGCGGRAMRKRVLIKNFVSDLFKMPKKPATSREQDMASSDEEYEDFDLSEVSFLEEDIDEFRLEDLSSYEQNSRHDMWHNQPHHNTLYSGVEMGGFGSLTYGYDSLSSSFTSPPSNYQPYDMYGSSMSESATEGDMPMPSDPMASLSGTTFDVYGQATSNRPSSSFYAADDFFMSTLVDPPVFPADAAEPESLTSEDTHELTDLDVATGESHANKYKRRSTEMFDDFNVSFQKRIKI
uniref:Uncharacterized protein n=1 Tax=Caenorhabditis japonica TaxID=281687 RepID=A0A8R1I0I7_CAEJA